MVSFFCGRIFTIYAVSDGFNVLKFGQANFGGRKMPLSKILAYEEGNYNLFWQQVIERVP